MAYFHRVFNYLTSTVTRSADKRLPSFPEKKGKKGEKAGMERPRETQLVEHASPPVRSCKGLYCRLRRRGWGGLNSAEHGSGGCGNDTLHHSHKGTNGKTRDTGANGRPRNTEPMVNPQTQGPVVDFDTQSGREPMGKTRDTGDNGRPRNTEPIAKPETHPGGRLQYAVLQGTNGKEPRHRGQW
ncbi:unnamed protein product [Arctogadus glacialis]